MALVTARRAGTAARSPCASPVGAAVLVADLRELPIRVGWRPRRTCRRTRSSSATAGVLRSRAVTSPPRTRYGPPSTAVESFGRLDVAVANAGINIDIHDLVDEPFDQYDVSSNVNQHGVWWTCKEAATPHGRAGRGRRIVAIASIAGLVGTPTVWPTTRPRAPSSSSSHARAAARAARDHRQRDLPGWVRTAMTVDAERPGAERARSGAASARSPGRAGGRGRRRVLPRLRRRCLGDGDRPSRRRRLHLRVTTARDLVPLAPPRARFRGAHRHARGGLRPARLPRRSSRGRRRGRTARGRALRPPP